ncbi:hypothetical protein Sros01_24470 [Streptomyces roseochromogenus]|nr:hypothetical protein Sros01_24470 [Streptomyces roseochromogenus]
MGGESTEPAGGSPALGWRGRRPGGGRRAERRYGAGIYVRGPPTGVFGAVGFEHRVANTALFGPAILDGPVGFRDLFRNPVFTAPGSIPGGALLVGAVYRFPGRGRGECGVMPSD